MALRTKPTSTETGRNASIALTGQWLRACYVDPGCLLIWNCARTKRDSCALDWCQQVFAWPIGRTIMSALSNLYWFYPIDYDGSPTLPRVVKSYFLPHPWHQAANYKGGIVSASAQVPTCANPHGQRLQGLSASIVPIMPQGSLRSRQPINGCLPA
jgi:hypothetical protein